MKIKNVFPYIISIIISFVLISCNNDNKIVNPEPTVQIDSSRFIWTIQEVPFGILRHTIVMTDTDVVFGINWLPDSPPNVFRIKSWKMENYYFPDNVFPAQVVSTEPNDVYVVCNDTVPGKLKKPHIEKWSGNGFTYLNIPIIQQNGFGGSAIGNCISKTGEIYMPSKYHNVFIYDGTKIYEIPGPTDTMVIQQMFFDKKNVLKCYSEYQYYVNDTIGLESTYIFYEYDGNKWKEVYELPNKYGDPKFIGIFNSNIGVISMQGIYELTETNNLVLKVTNNFPYYSFAFPIAGESFDDFISLGGISDKTNNKNWSKDGTFSILNWNGKSPSLEFRHLDFIYPTGIRYYKGYYCLIKSTYTEKSILYIGRPKNMELKNQNNSVSKNKNY